ncbi:MAG TPA: hypothetical protein PLW31_01340 [Bacteroidales bacterium]|nr:hypothetical protein [Bacteroidales bacterium]HOX76654.1 hypothetical protein [Bacteroidales bacterium]HPI86169.1 hypothetical protein [Bacteroidales bacterium]HPM93017.1 hypothetical protein [Bacteroidales bacterium]
MKKLLNILFLIFLMAAVIILPAFTDLEHHRNVYREFTVEVLNQTDKSLITTSEIHELVRKNFGEIKGSPVSIIDIDKMEKLVDGNPYVSACEVYKTMDCELIMKARVREPLVRIANRQGEQFYLDLNGCAMPLNPAHPSHVTLAGGNISERLMSIDKSEKPLDKFDRSSVLHQIYPVAYAISRDEFLESFIDQIYIHENGEIELVPRVGSQIILLGNGEDAAEKLENLKVFYRKVMRNIDWNTYKTINLKYKNQVVCIKNPTL